MNTDDTMSLPILPDDAETISALVGYLGVARAKLAPKEGEDPAARAERLSRCIRLLDSLIGGAQSLRERTATALVYAQVEQDKHADEVLKALE